MVCVQLLSCCCLETSLNIPLPCTSPRHKPYPLKCLAPMFLSMTLQKEVSLRNMHLHHTVHLPLVFRLYQIHCTEKTKHTWLPARSQAISTCICWTRAVTWSVYIWQMRLGLPATLKLHQRQQDLGKLSFRQQLQIEQTRLRKSKGCFSFSMW